MARFPGYLEPKGDVELDNGIAIEVNSIKENLLIPFEHSRSDRTRHTATDGFVNVEVKNVADSFPVDSVVLDSTGCSSLKGILHLLFGVIFVWGFAHRYTERCGGVTPHPKRVDCLFTLHPYSSPAIARTASGRDTL